MNRMKITEASGSAFTLVIGCGLGFLLAVCIQDVDLSTLHASESTDKPTVNHRVVFPATLPGAEPERCSELAAAYAKAVIELRAAQFVADETYERWYNCEMGDEPDPEPEPEPEPEPDPGQAGE